MTPSSITRLRRRLRLSATLPALAGLTLLTASSAHAKPVPDNLGNGLDKLVQSNLDVVASQKSGRRLSTATTYNGKTYSNETAALIASRTLGDASGRPLVRINFNSSVPFEKARAAMVAGIPSLTITAVDPSYKGAGVANAYVDVADVAALAKMPGVTSVVLEWKPRHSAALQTAPVRPVAPVSDPAVQPPQTGATVGEVITKVGTAFDQGVTQHRVDQISQFFNPAATLNLAGQNMQIACISNSFAANTTAPASVDVTNNDLPGSASATQTTPVFILQDDLSSTTSDDEGRGMCQIVYKMAPYAKIGFGTADSGEVGFANNIRGLAGINTSTYPNASTQGFAADTICDDVGYFDEPYFQDGIISAGIEATSAAGVCYFSSAANDIGTNGYDSDTRWVANGTGLTAAAGNTALTGTNIDLTGVPTALYAAGFHNFNPNGRDVAQTVNITSTTNEPPTILQWNDVYDQNTNVSVTGTLYSGSGTYTTAAVNFTVTGTVTAGTNYQVVETATNNSGFDAIVTVYKSDGTTVISGPQDTGTDETVRFTAPANDTGFVVKVDHFGTTMGTFNLVVQSFQGFTTPGPTTNLSLLVFNLATGAYISGSSLTADSTATNEPIQLGVTARPTGATQVQYVIARSVVPAAGFNFPTHLRYLIPGNGLGGIGPAEYFSYNTVTTGGHAMSPSCNGSAAYSVFRPSLPETFSSPGPVTIYYNTSDQRLATPEVRLQPRMAFVDGANVSANLSTVFANDSTADPDTQGNFFGTSAAGPHGAAIAALVLQAKGGRRAITPAQMTSLLQRSTFPHDLDPNFSSGSARVTGGTTGTGKIAITISSDGSAPSAAGTSATGGNDTNAFTVSYVGGSSVTSLVFNPGGTAATAGGVSGGNNGVTYSSQNPGGTVTYFENNLPGVAFFPTTKAFTLNTGAITAAGTATVPAVTGAVAVASNPSNTTATQYYTLSITIPSGNFQNTSQLRFTVGRGVAVAPTTGAGITTVTTATTGAPFYSADLFGGGVILPSGQVVNQGMTFSGTTADGGTFTGTIQNRIGAGWATQDGYGLVNAQTAVSQTVQ